MMYASGSSVMGFMSWMVMGLSSTVGVSQPQNMRS